MNLEIAPTKRPGGIIRRLYRGREAVVYPLLFNRARVLIGEPRSDAGEIVYDFASVYHAVLALVRWDGTDTMQGGIRRS